MAILTNNQVNFLRSFFLRELPLYLEEKIAEIIDNNEIQTYMENLSERTKCITTYSPKSYCKSISVLIKKALEALGFTNIELKKIRIFLGNKKAQILFKEGGLKAIRDYRLDHHSDIYTAGCGLTENHDDYHVILRINDLLIDPTAIQMKRVEKGIIINNYLCSRKALLKKYKAILIYDILDKDVDNFCGIATHPDYELIITYVINRISEILKSR